MRTKMNTIVHFECSPQVSTDSFFLEDAETQEQTKDPSWFLRASLAISDQGCEKMRS